MDYCHVCDKPSSELSKCEGCKQDVCPTCCVAITPQNMIDFSFCITCDELSEIR
jgi:hypothetical protein